mmetsp:Transcript_58108/g.102161  ORF Transcript_58108/g.102161 Transcript_58108/m.102161 type:complete len:294 (-) Transcript_58108:295-1176(-)
MMLDLDGVGIHGESLEVYGTDPGQLLLLAVLRLAQHLLQQIDVNRGVVRTIGGSLPGNCQLADLTSRVALGGTGETADQRLVHALHGDGLRTRRRVQQETIHVLRYHAHALVERRQAELDHVIDTIVDGPIKLLGLVGSIHNHKLVTCLTGAVQEGVQGVTHVLGDALRTTLAQEGIGLVHEDQYTLVGGVGPVKQLVDLCHGVLAQRCDITTGHDGIVQTTLSRKTLREHGLSRAGRAVQQQVSKRRAVLLRVGRAGGHAGQALLQCGVEYDVLQGIVALCRAEGQLRGVQR